MSPSALTHLLSAPADVAPIDSMATWWARHQQAISGAASTLEQAILGGFAADRLGYAFASGYQAALRSLWPALPKDRIASLSVTERGGNHPRAIEARLTPSGDGYRLSGNKRWTTVPDNQGVLLAAAWDGTEDEGRKRIRVVRVEASLPGVSIALMPEPPFVPEITHGEVRFDDVPLTAGALLPGDGYERYVKPFRTVEDLHVQAALFGYLLGEARRHALPRDLVERLAAVLAMLSGLAAGDASDPAMHVALGGALRIGAGVIADMDLLWAKTESPAHARWERDRLLLSVAETARGKRLARAWEKLGAVKATPV
jgi:acyl-CoA dehydrogenase